MAHFQLDLAVPLAAPEAWRRLWDLDAHGQVIPFTSTSGEGTGGGRLRAGARFTARTALGPFGFDDVMQVDQWQPPTVSTPGRAVVSKHGSVIRGSIRAQVRPTTGGSVVVWEQDIRVRGVPGALDPAVSTVARVAYGRVIGRLLRRRH